MSWDEWLGYDLTIKLLYARSGYSEESRLKTAVVLDNLHFTIIAPLETSQYHNQIVSAKEKMETMAFIDKYHF